MAWSSPRTWTAGELVTAAIMNAHVRDQLTAGFPYGTTWQSWTPTLTQSGAVTFTNTRAGYYQAGQVVVVRGVLSITGTGTTANAIVVSGLPVAADNAEDIQGPFSYFDTGTSYYVGSALGVSTTSMKFVSDGSGDFLGAAPSFACASGDILRFTLTYQAA